MAKALLLIPTEIECSWATDLVERLAEQVTVAVCGFGPVVAGIRTAQLIAAYQPQRVLLVGIAGAIDQELQLGAAYAFDRVACYGIGVGCGATFQSAEEMGWYHWSAAAQGSDALGARAPSIADTLTLSRSDSRGSDHSRLLLSVCAASAGPDDVARHQQKFPRAAAEDMEGFSVAAACALQRVPLGIVRGISNRAGDREHQHWQSAAAMRAALQLAATILDV